jgi:predicted nucleic acid-binding protein
MGFINKIYLDTSVISFLYADDAPEKQEITIDFFDNFIKTGIYKATVSEFVLQEIENTSNILLKEKLKAAVVGYPIEIISESDVDEVQRMAFAYIGGGVIPPKKLLDALHVAICTVSSINFLVSWNYKHLANINRERRILSINLENNYINPLRIITPIELINYES